MIKYILLVVKIVLILTILVAGLIGFLLFKTWQKNERPRVDAVAWDTESLKLGSAATLEIDLKVPWHRVVSKAEPNKFPSGFMPQPDAATLTKGRLSLWTGYRNWSAKIPMVAFDDANPKGQTVVLPLKHSRRIPSPTVATISVPALEIESPKLANNVQDSNKLLKPRPKQEVVEAVVIEEAPRAFPWLLVIVLAAIALIATFVWLIARRVKMGVPPWKIALDDLKNLEGQQQDLEPVPFFSRLTDILKLYTANRFDTHSDAETATELLDSLRGLGQLPDGLDSMVQQADMIKFAGAAGSRETYRDSLQAVRQFVEQTVPEETTN